MSNCYSRDGGAALDALIDGHLAGIRDDLLASLPATGLDALVLGGGYGRGEGGCVMTADGPRPYNDYDLVLVHHLREQHRLATALGAIHDRQGPRCGLHVDITPIHRDRLPRLPPALTWYELGQGHRVVWGDGSVMAPLAQRRLGEVHPSEWGRLLVNRGTGVAMAVRRRRGLAVRTGADEPTAAFAHRQAMKAWLALGDVRLAADDLYHPLVARRQAAAAGLQDRPSWWPRWEAACRFKTAPTAPPPEVELDRDLEQVAAALIPALAATPAAPFRPLAALWTLRYVPWRSWWPPLRYPRERLRHALVAALGGDDAGRDRHAGSWDGLERLWELSG